VEKLNITIEHTRSGGLQTQYLSFSNSHTTSHHKATAKDYK